MMYGAAVARWVAVLAAFVNLGIHTALTPMHLAEMRYIGLLFILGSALLAAVIVGLASDHPGLRTAGWLGGSLICVVEMVLYVVSRTGGLPGGYKEGWFGRAEDLLGLASLVVEALFVACAAVALTHEPAPVLRANRASGIRSRSATGEALTAPDGGRYAVRRNRVGHG